MVDWLELPSVCLYLHLQSHCQNEQADLVLLSETQNISSSKKAPVLQRPFLRQQTDDKKAQNYNKMSEKYYKELKNDHKNWPDWLEDTKWPQRDKTLAPVARPPPKKWQNSTIENCEKWRTTKKENSQRHKTKRLQIDINHHKEMPNVHKETQNDNKIVAPWQQGTFPSCFYVWDSESSGSPASHCSVSPSVWGSGLYVGAVGTFSVSVPRDQSIHVHDWLIEQWHHVLMTDFNSSVLSQCD